MKTILKRFEGAIYIVAALLLIFALVIKANHTPKTTLEASAVLVTALDSRGSGTGFILQTSTGKVTITNNHVCNISTSGRIRISNRFDSRIVRILAKSADKDLCLLEAFDAPAVRVAKRAPALLEELTIGGHPLGKTFHTRSGIYYGEQEWKIAFPAPESGACDNGNELVESMFYRLCVQTMQLGILSAPTYPGNSGSPVVNAGGELVGVINSADSRDNEGGFIPLRDLKGFIDAYHDKKSTL